MVPRALFLAVVSTVLLVSPGKSAVASWRWFVRRDGQFVRSELSPGRYEMVPSAESALPPDWEPLGDVRSAAFADVTADGSPEWVLVTWRPWQDWRIQEWVAAPSPIASFREASGDACTVILVDAQDGGVLWAGSPLPAPIVAMAVGDVDSDGLSELVTLEGEYDSAAGMPGRHIDVWGWQDFRFGLEWRSEVVEAAELRLFNDAEAGALAIGYR